MDPISALIPHLLAKLIEIVPDSGTFYLAVRDAEGQAAEECSFTVAELTATLEEITSPPDVVTLPDNVVQGRFGGKRGA